MAYYRTCPRCGANLDPGERCDCEQETPFRITPSEEKNPEPYNHITLNEEVYQDGDYQRA